MPQPARLARPDGLAALVLAAGAGNRLRPLTTLRPKPLCPVGDSTPLDLALARVGQVAGPESTVVNAHHLADQVIAHVGNRARISREDPEALGTAGAVGAIRDWLAGRDLVIANGDVVYGGAVDVASLTDGWDRRRPRLLVVEDRRRPDFDGRWRFAGLSWLPGGVAARLPARPAGLYEVVWRSSEPDLVPVDVAYVDCGDPSSYLAANLLLSGGEPVVGAGAVVEGTLVRSVVWPGAVVHPGERLVEAVRARDSAGRDVTVPAPQQ